MNLKDAQGRYRTQSLFVEQIDSRTPYKPVYTLKPLDLPDGTPSLKKIYLDMMDPTEFLFAERVFGCYEHWDKLASAQWFQPHVEQWRRELEMKLQGLAIKEIREKAEQGDTQAAKWLGDKKWKDKGKVGRPHKPKTVDSSEDDYSADAARLFGIDGGKS